MSEMTPAERAVIDAAKALSSPDAHDRIWSLVYDLRDAVRALDAEPATPNFPATITDGEGDTWTLVSSAPTLYALDDRDLAWPVHYTLDQIRSEWGIRE